MMKNFRISKKNCKRFDMEKIHGFVKKKYTELNVKENFLVKKKKC